MIAQLQDAPGPERTTSALVSVDDLTVGFRVGARSVQAVDHVTLGVGVGETLGIVGESGSGKSTLGLALMGLLPANAEVKSGRVSITGRDMSAPDQARGVRWSTIAMAFQNAMAALNPVLTIERQFYLAMHHHLGVNRKMARERAEHLLDRVGISPTKLSSYPHELSGGQRQRVMIALAVSCEPRVLVADEPTTALDVVAQAQVLDLLRGLHDELKLAIVLISHDLGAVARLCQDVAVVYAGRVVEYGPTRDVLQAPRSPYTRALRDAYPPLDHDVEMLTTIGGSPPNLINPPPGCRFHPRCVLAIDRCRVEVPELALVAKNHWAACHLSDELARPDDGARGEAS